jgi:hypothetical protein
MRNPERTKNTFTPAQPKLINEVTCGGDREQVRNEPRGRAELRYRECRPIQEFSSQPQGGITASERQSKRLLAEDTEMEPESIASKISYCSDTSAIYVL